MAKFKKQFWGGQRRKENGDMESIPEPDWYSRAKDPIDYVDRFKEETIKRPEGALIPRAMVGSSEVSIREAFEIYKAHNCESFRLNFSLFKISLINGTSFRTTKGVIRKP